MPPHSMGSGSFNPAFCHKSKQAMCCCISMTPRWKTSSVISKNIFPDRTMRRNTTIYSSCLIFFPEQFNLTLEDGRTIKVDRAAKNLPMEIERMPEARWLKENTIAYIRIPSPIVYLKTNRWCTCLQFQKAKTLIIDARNNAGGLKPQRLIATLMDRSYHAWKESTPVHIGLFDFYDELHKGQPTKDMSDYERGYTSALIDFFGKSQLD